MSPKYIHCLWIACALHLNGRGRRLEGIEWSITARRRTGVMPQGQGLNGSAAFVDCWSCAIQSDRTKSDYGSSWLSGACPHKSGKLALPPEADSAV
jgi:hypothetical protein